MVIIGKTTKQVLTGAMSFACITWLFGCSPKMIVHVDGYPSPEEVDVLWSRDGSVAMKWFFSRWFMKRIESRGFSENIEYPEHLLFDRRNILPSDTTNVVINVQVYNPHMKRYRLVKSVTVGNQEEVEAIAGWTIREVQHTVIPGPIIANKEIKLSVRIVSGEEESLSEQMISTGELIYMIEPSERDLPVENERR